MEASLATNAARADGAGVMPCIVLDVGTTPVDRDEFSAAIRSILDGRVGAIARDRNAICYRVGLSPRDGGPCTAIVKAPRPGPQRSNPDATFAWEAQMLAALPDMGIAGAPALLARVAAAGSHFLFVTEVPGHHPDPRTHPLGVRQLRAIVDRLLAMDRRGFMHYDLKAANILVDGERAAFIDFEFARPGDCRDAYAPGAAALCEDFNVSANPFFPARSNVANFEFRALDRYLVELGAIRSPASADGLLRDWLHGKSTYHRAMADFLAALARRFLDRIAGAGATTPADARLRLRRAVAHEKLLASLFADPPDAVVQVERRLMAYRRAVFEQPPTGTGEIAGALLAEIRDAAALPDAYREAALRVVSLVGRSVHPRP